MSTKPKTQKQDSENAQQDFLNERIPFKLPKDNFRYKDDVSVTLNGKTILIQRGVAVNIPRKYLLVLQQSFDQAEIAAAVAQGFADSYAKDQSV